MYVIITTKFHHRKVIFTSLTEDKLQKLIASKKARG